jgi:single-strand DNA-binding protein
MYQKIIIIGNLGRDPEMKYLSSGDPFTSFSVAVNDQFINQSGQKVKSTTWFRVSVFGKQAENVNQYLKKGSKVLVDGRLTSDNETGGPRLWKRQDGSISASFEIKANTVQFLSSRMDDPVGSGFENEENINGEPPF